MIRLLLLLLLLVILFSSIESVSANPVEPYVSILSNGKYEVGYTLNYEVEEGGRSIQGKNENILVRDRGADLWFVSIDSYRPSEKYQYVYNVTYLVKGMAYTKLAHEKNKTIEIDKVRFVRRKDDSDTDKSMLYGSKKWSIAQEDEFYSMLGAIAEKSGVLPRYKTELVKKANETVDGQEYAVEEYKIVSPYMADLKLYFLGNNLIKSIKIYNNTERPNEKFPFINQTYNGYVVLDVQKFSETVNDKYYTLVSKR